MSMPKAKLSPTTYIIITGTNGKCGGKIRKSLTFHSRIVFQVSRLGSQQYFPHRNPCHVHVTPHPRA